MKKKYKDFCQADWLQGMLALRGSVRKKFEGSSQTGLLQGTVTLRGSTKKKFEGSHQRVSPLARAEAASVEAAWPLAKGKTTLEAAHGLRDLTTGTLPPQWEERTTNNPFLQAAFLQQCRSRGEDFFLVNHQAYLCCEYEKKINLFAFGKQNFYVPFTVIAPPASVDAPGYGGELRALIEDYRRRRGNFLMLNLRKEDVEGIKGHCKERRERKEAMVAEDSGEEESFGEGKPLHQIGPESHEFTKKIVLGRTLSSCSLRIPFASMEQYMKALRSPYRYRLRKAKKKGASLVWQRVNPQDFDKKMHKLYLQVLQRSDFPLETLGEEFFRQSQGTIYALYPAEKKCFREFVAREEAMVMEAAGIEELDIGIEDTHGVKDPEAGEEDATTMKDIAARKEEVFHQGLGRGQTSPLAFIMTLPQGEDLAFLFGGMDYSSLEEYDLYFNMLLKVVEEGIQGGYRRIHFGQTGEQSKLRVGCALEDRYMLLITSNPLLRFFAKMAKPLLEYRPPKETYRVFQGEGKKRRSS